MSPSTTRIAALWPATLRGALPAIAVKHGLELKVGSGSIEVVARAISSGIETSGGDSGLGLPAEDGEETGPFTRPANSDYGLQHVRDRLLAVYGPAAGLSRERRHPTGVCAVILIPV